MSEVLGGANRKRVDIPFAHGAWLMDPSDVTLDRLPDFEIRTRHVESREVSSEFFRASLKVNPAEAKALDLTMVKNEMVAWLRTRYGQERVPSNGASWDKYVDNFLLPYFFATRLRHLRPVKSLQSMLEAGPKMEAPQLKLHLTMDTNFYVHTSIYRTAGEDQGADNKGAEFVFEASYDSHVYYGGAVAGHAEVFGSRQILLAHHRFVNLRSHFGYDEICQWVEKRVDKYMPGILAAGLVKFHWLPEGKFLGGDEPWPFTAAAARSVVKEHKEEA
jgi:hypothetical protein